MVQIKGGNAHLLSVQTGSTGSINHNIQEGGRAELNGQFLQLSITMTDNNLCVWGVGGGGEKTLIFSHTEHCGAAIILFLQS